jgi:hypothetical protein
VKEVEDKEEAEEEIGDDKGIVLGFKFGEDNL